MSTDKQRLVNCLQDYLEEFNVLNPGQHLSIILFDYCIDHLIRICRILR